MLNWNCAKHFFAYNKHSPRPFERRLLESLLAHTDREHIKWKSSAVVQTSAEMRSRLSGKKTKTLSWTAQRARRKHTGFPNWQLGAFREVVPSVSSCGRIEKQFSVLMPLTKSQTKLENYENHSSFTQTRLLQPQLCASLHFKLVFVSSLDFALLASLFLCSLYAISVQRRRRLLLRQRKRENLSKKHWFEVNFSDRLTFYGRNSPTPLFRDKSETDWDRPGMTK